MRDIATKLHRYVGLFLAVFLMTSGVTGSVLVFRHELEAALSPSLFRAAAPSPTAVPLDAFAARDELAARLPAARVDHVPLDRQPGKSFLFFVDWPAQAAGSVARDDEYFVDPYSRRILGSRADGDITQGTKNLVPFLYRLHFSMLAGDLGIYLLGFVGLLWSIDCFVGAYLTLPRRSRLRTHQHGKRFWVRWWPAFRIRGKKPYALAFTGHRALGLWFFTMLFVFAWSSVGMNLPEVYHPVMRALFSYDDARSNMAALSEPQRPGLSWREAHRAGQTAVEREAERQDFEVLSERWIIYDGRRNVFRYIVRTSLDVSRRYPTTTAWLDGDTGALVAFEAPTGPSAGNTITTWLVNLHFASVAAGGWPYRLFVFAFGWVVALLAATGAWIWWKKRGLRVQALRQRPPDRRTTRSHKERRTLMRFLSQPRCVARRLCRPRSRHANTTSMRRATRWLTRALGGSSARRPRRSVDARQPRDSKGAP